MEGTPLNWRTEVWHPLLVHFPIALLILSTLTGVLWFVFRSRVWAPQLRFSMSLMLWVGIVSFWIAFHFGNLAYSVIVRQICDPRVLKDHLYWAYVAGVTFSIVVVLDVLQRLFVRLNRTGLSALMILLMLIGSASLAYDGHLGASLVYEQAAGVNVPSEDCSGFE